MYNHSKKAFQTSGINSVFAAISQLSKGYEGNKKGTTPFLARQSLSAEKEGFEPPEVLPSIVFKTTAIDHSATSPRQK